MAGNERTKKAKLAHEKKGNNAPKAVGARFSPKMILETVEWLAGERGVIADLDGNGRLAIIPSRFSMTDRRLRGRLRSCESIQGVSRSKFPIG
jgi:hypothetical protein